MSSQAVVMMEVPQKAEPLPLSDLLGQAPGGLLWLLIPAIGLLLHLGLSVVVLIDGRKRRTEMMAAPLWALLVFFTGLMGFLVYWLVNREAPRRDPG
ncbi:MAG: hypothetical protein ACE37K_24005 [Planctomycetota bacterium]